MLFAEIMYNGPLDTDRNLMGQWHMPFSSLKHEQQFAFLPNYTLAYQIKRIITELCLGSHQPERFNSILPSPIPVHWVTSDA